MPNDKPEKKKFSGYVYTIGVSIIALVIVYIIIVNAYNAGYHDGAVGIIEWLQQSAKRSGVAL